MQGKLQSKEIDPFDLPTVRVREWTIGTTEGTYLQIDYMIRDGERIVYTSPHLWEIAAYVRRQGWKNMNMRLCNEDQEFLVAYMEMQ